MGIGQFYSVIAILITVPVVIFMVGTFITSQQIDESSTDKIVADQLRLIALSIENDFEKGFEITSKRALLGLTDFIIQSGTYLNNETFNISPSELFLELFFNGTIQGNVSYVMTNNTLNTWKARILNLSTGFDIDLNVIGLTSGNINATNMNGTWSIGIKVEDKFRKSKIEKPFVNKKFQISIIGFEDPTFPLETNGLVRRQYYFYDYKDFVANFSGSDANNNFSGNVSFDYESPGDPAKILVVTSLFSVSDPYGWGCIVFQEGDPWALGEPPSCYLSGVSNAVQNINDTINGLRGYRKALVDDNTNSIWFLPIEIMIENKLYYANETTNIKVRGMNIFERMFGQFNSSSPQMFTFMHVPELVDAGVQVKSGVSLLDWMYYTDFPLPPRKIRGLPDWFVIDVSTARYLRLERLAEPKFPYG